MARDRLRLTAEAVRPILDTEGAVNIPWTQVADASPVEEALRGTASFEDASVSFPLR